ncbi:helix-turn-helix transcriptional regulator [Amaricoccus solimangrovi]|uniref:Helix-turn-helix transcriptional regulator n=1 Tax=Amaricoccus solimangrovi TaxID=2589815 RepID=A0A501WBS2_9RHOB|nr:helix-turn-helix transcriptional regulator [Amaricoccus solimangrovi]TPE47383.1 helix-turn-helix transcriptional regulator [Amaricoccus solimangrovi]
MPQSQSQRRRDYAEIVVFTGDLVASSKLSPDQLGQAMATLEEAYGDVSRAWAARPGGAGNSAEAPDYGFSAFRGDSWQCLGPDPAFALRWALILRARLGALGRAFDTRISVGIGSGWLSEQDGRAIASGPAFELSGRGLDSIGQNRRLAIAWEKPPREAPLIRAVFALADEISRNWTPGQARVFARLLVGMPRPSQETLAGALDITQQTVATHLAGGGDWALREALEALEREGQ